MDEEKHEPKTVTSINCVQFSTVILIDNCSNLAEHLNKITNITLLCFFFTFDSNEMLRSILFFWMKYIFQEIISNYNLWLTFIDSAK